jgi:AmmeMemoRadiSam system protein B
VNMGVPILHVLGITMILCFRVESAELYPMMFESDVVFRKFITAAEKETRPLLQKITGVTVPHHLLAADMIASTLYLASAGKPRRIIILSPDHYKRGTTPGTTTTRSFQTVFGVVPVDGEAARALGTHPCFSESNLFSHEHGVQALLPFIAHWFHDVPILAIALDVHSRPADWKQMAAAIQPLVTADTLVIQSTDFSHYLTQETAASKDQETLRLLAAGDPSRIADLGQPDHLDSKAAQWIQMTLQREVFKVSAPVVADNRNAVRYGGRPNEPRTTSYVTQLFSPEFIPASALPGKAWFFGGDTHFGRHLARVFADPERALRIRGSILAITGSRPLIVNLEGVMIDGDPTAYHPPMRIAMEASTALDELKLLGVTAVSVANNHSLDFGRSERERMIAELHRNGITVLDSGKPQDFGPFRLGALSDVENRPVPASEILTSSDFDSWKQPDSRTPLFGFLHCGIEYKASSGTRESNLAVWAENAGASLIIGCHPHRPSPGWDYSNRSIRFFSMGNLIFDQLDPENTGGLVEVRFFEQGTWFARWIPTGNLYRRSIKTGGQTGTPAALKPLPAPHPDGAD